jgi:hypothetical protein
MIQVTQHLQIQSVVPGGEFTGYTGTTFGENVGAGKKIYLRDASVTSSSGDFSWAASFTGTAPPGDAGSQVIVSQTAFEGASGTIDLNIEDTGDLHALYPDGQNFRVYWALAFSTNATTSYPNGIELTLSYTLEVD